MCSRQWTIALSTPPDYQPLSRPLEQLNVSLSERHVTMYIVVFLAFFANQDVVHVGMWLNRRMMDVMCRTRAFWQASDISEQSQLFVIDDCTYVW